MIAKVHGVCLAGGTQLASICDVSFVADDTKIGTPQLPLGAGYVSRLLGLVRGPEEGQGDLLPRRHDDQRAEAVGMGLFNRAVPAADLDERSPPTRRRVARTPKDILALQKQSINKTQDIAGLPPGAGPEHRGRRHRPRLARGAGGQPLHPRPWPARGPAGVPERRAT